MRLFVALDIADEIRRQVGGFLEGVRGFAPDARWVQAESLHVTLKFLGERPEAELARIETALAQIHSAAVALSFRGHGFFPTARSARVFWIGVEAGPELKALAAQVDGAMAALGVERERHEFSPHLTLARGGRGSGVPHSSRGNVPDLQFERLQKRVGTLAPLEFGTMTAPAFHLFESKLAPGGAQYRKVKTFALER
jgi:2'-5' RNA ligase